MSIELDDDAKKAVADFFNPETHIRIARDWALAKGCYDIADEYEYLLKKEEE